MIQPADGKNARPVDPATAKQRFIFSRNLSGVTWVNMPYFNTAVDLTEKNKENTRFE